MWCFFPLPKVLEKVVFVLFQHFFGGNKWCVCVCVCVRAVFGFSQ